MEGVISELINYISILFMGLYVFNAYRNLYAKNSQKSHIIAKQMKLIAFITISVNFFALSINGGDEKAFLAYIIYIGTAFFIKKAYKNLYPEMSEQVWTNMYLLMGIGNVMIARLSSDTAIRQAVFEAAGLTAGLILPKIIRKIKGSRISGLLYYILGTAVLMLVYLKGEELYGAKNWLKLGKIMLQPSEFVKILFVAGTAVLLAKAKGKISVTAVSAIAAAHVIILVLSKDLGGALLYYMVYIGMLYCATSNITYVAAGILGGVAAAAAAYQIFSHVRVRVEAFIDPFALYQNKGYQLSQSLFSICSGSWLGGGLGNGNPGEIPVVKSDFIFSGIAEEMGGITCICIILICLNLFIMFMSLSSKIKRPFLKLAGMGISLLYLFQVFLNIAGVIKLIPSTGITLPFLSSGGSSVISSIFMFAIIQGMYVENAVGDDEAEKAEKAARAEAEAKGKRALKAYEKELEKKHARKRSETIRGKEFNGTILKLLYAGSAVMLITIMYFTWIISVDSKEINANIYNTRTAAKRNEVRTGTIYSKNGDILAQTIDDTRYYPYENLFAHVVGRSNYGLSGIEASYRNYLTGSNLEDALQKLYKINNSKIPGNNVITTLDVELTKAVYEAMGDYNGAAVVLDAKTGAVLAMVSKPDYNPQTIEENYDILTTSDNNAPLLNRAVSGLYPPGSTFKILTALEYIRENTVYEAFSYECAGSERKHNVTIHCASNKAHGVQNLKQAFANSCNSAFAYLGADLDYDLFYANNEKFLFNSSIGGDFKGNMGSFSLNSEAPEEDISQTVIGLGKTLVTPLQNALITLSVANGGKLMQPYVVERVEDAGGKSVMTNSAVVLDTVMTSEEAKYIAECMREVVVSGTAKSLNELGIEVAGKTGTADYDSAGNAHAWFTGFAPYDNPEIVVCIILEGAGSGSRHAVPAAKKIFEAYFKD